VEEVLCVVGCQKGVDVEVLERVINRGCEKFFSATYIQAMPRAVQDDEDNEDNDDEEEEEQEEEQEEEVKERLDVEGKENGWMGG